LNYLIEGVARAAQDVKTAATVSTTTATAGVATWLEMIPTDIGKIATIVGILLSSVLIIVHVRKDMRETREHRVRMERLENGNDI